LGLGNHRSRYGASGQSNAFEKAATTGGFAISQFNLQLLTPQKIKIMFGDVIMGMVEKTGPRCFPREVPIYLSQVLLIKFMALEVSAELAG
jgi:hypothetical protein